MTEESDAPARPPRLLDQVRDAIRRKHYSRRTEEAYLHWIRRYWLFHGRADPALLGAAEATAFLTDLAVRLRVAAATQNQALAAILFLYRHVLHQDLPGSPTSCARSGPCTFPSCCRVPKSGSYSSSSPACRA